MPEFENNKNLEPLEPRYIQIAWTELMSKFPDKLKQEFDEERPNPTQEDVEAYQPLHLIDPNPISIPLKELLENNKDHVLHCSPEIIDEINKKWGTSFDARLSEVHDQNPNRVHEYSQMPPETAQPSVLVDGEIHFGVGRFIAALLRKDSELKVWNLTRKK